MDYKRIFSESRMQTFITIAGGNLEFAEQLYLWNLKLSGAIYESLSLVEVALRNTIDRQLAVANSEQNESPQDWIFNPSSFVCRAVGEEVITTAIRHAKKAIRGHKRDVNHGDVLSQMTFGTWNSLLPKRRNLLRNKLWEEYLLKGFPNVGNEAELIDAIRIAYKTRNRIAHLEPVLNVKYGKNNFQKLRYIAHCIDLDFEELFVSQQRITSILKARPRI